MDHTEVHTNSTLHYLWFFGSCRIVDQPDITEFGGYFLFDGNTFGTRIRAIERIIQDVAA